MKKMLIYNCVFEKFVLFINIDPLYKFHISIP